MWVSRAIVVTGFTGMALLGAAAPASAVGEYEDYCSRHPLASICPAGGSDPLPVDDSSGYPPGAIPPAVEDGTEGEVVPNIDGGVSSPGMPGAI